MREHNGQHPDDLFRFRQAVILDAINQHPDPENRAEDAEDPNQWPEKKNARCQKERQQQRGGEQ